METKVMATKEELIDALGKIREEYEAKELVNSKSVEDIMQEEILEAHGVNGKLLEPIVGVDKLCLDKAQAYIREIYSEEGMDKSTLAGEFMAYYDGYLAALESK